MTTLGCRNDSARCEDICETADDCDDSIDIDSCIDDCMRDIEWADDNCATAYEAFADCANLEDHDCPDTIDACDSEIEDFFDDCEEDFEYFAYAAPFAPAVLD